MTILVKICGLTHPEDARVALESGADLLGFIFVPGTPRALDPEHCDWVRELAGRGTVGVFRDMPLGDVEAIRRALRLDWIQLHGAEPDAWLTKLGPRVLRRVGLEQAVDWQRVAAIAEHGLPLFDPGAGDGHAWDWRQLHGAPPGLRFGLAGGLTPANVGAAIRVVRPALVDVASGVELSPGVKDAVAVRSFVAEARAATAIESRDRAEDG